MARMIINGSSSQGNSYILDCGEESLLLELGVNFKSILKSMDYERGMEKVKACIVTHQHQDHAKYIPEALERGLPVYSCGEVASKYDGVKVIPTGVKTKIGGFKVQPMNVPHSCECYAYLIEHPSFGRLLFATDCTSFRYKIKNLNHVFIEANYSEDIILDNIVNNRNRRSHYENHMEIGDTISALQNNYGVSLQTVCLIHLSDGNADEKRFRDMVSEELCMDNVFVARKGEIIELNTSEF